MSFINQSYLQQSDHYNVRETEIFERFKLNSIDRWRHERLYDCVKPIINSSESWLTIGDGRYGSDAYFLRKRGVKQILSTDLSDTLLKIAKNRGIIDDYRIENAENLSFEDGSFEWVFCKEAYHHFPRPMIAVYEMLRVANSGIILIEPNDMVIESRFDSSLIQGWQIFKRSCINAVKKSLGKRRYYPFGGYEQTGNYIYSTSKREFEKVALGIDLPWIAFKGMNDKYQKGYETEPAKEDNPSFNVLKKTLNRENISARIGKTRYNLLVSILGKRKLELKTQMKLENDGFEFIHLPRNPFIKYD